MHFFSSQEFTHNLGKIVQAHQMVSMPMKVPCFQICSPRSSGFKVPQEQNSIIQGLSSTTSLVPLIAYTMQHVDIFIFSPFRFWDYQCCSHTKIFVNKKSSCQCRSDCLHFEFKLPLENFGVQCWNYLFEAGHQHYHCGFQLFGGAWIRWKLIRIC